MLENLEHEQKSELVESANHSSSLFRNSDDALRFYSKKLEVISSKYNQSVEELLTNSENAIQYNTDFVEAISLARTIRTLKSIG